MFRHLYWYIRNTKTNKDFVDVIFITSNTMASLTTGTHFSIQVVILGDVSAGKTTVLCALLRDTFGEITTKRTTVSK
jgi:GTPase SAR1 family protein